MADGGERIEGRAVIEVAARALAAWRSVGCAWWMGDFTFAPELALQELEDSPSACPGLPVVREAETLMRAKNSVSAMADAGLAALPDEQRDELREWEKQNPLNKGDGTNPRRTREFEQWRKARGILAVPRTRPARTVAAALSFAQLKGPLEPLLRLYACQEWDQWPTVRRYALACLPEPEAIEDAMSRILWRRAAVSQDDRAKQLGRRASTYRQQTAKAECLLEGWLLRASREFLYALHSDGNAPCQRRKQ